MQPVHIWIRRICKTECHSFKQIFCRSEQSPPFWKCYKTLTFCSLWTRCTIPCACHAKRHLNVQKWSEPLVFLTFWLPNVLRATTACIFSTSQLPKVVRKLVWFLHFDFEMFFAPQRRAFFRHLNFQKWSGSWCDFYILTSKCASRHNGVHFFDISTSKSGPEAGVISTFWLRNVLRATTACTFSTSQLPKGSEREVFLAFSLSNVLRATRACTFPTSQLPKVLRMWGAFSFFTCKCASRHNGVQFFISHPASWLRTRRFREPTFPPSGATNHWKNTVFRDFPTFSRTWIFFLLRLSLLFFFLLLFSYSAHLCFSSVHIVGSLTSKLPSIINNHINL